MKCALSLVVCAGAACVSLAEPLEQAEAVHAQSATKIEAMRTDGSYVLGRTIYFDGTSGRSGCIEYAFDQLSGLDLCNFGDVFPQSGVIQNAVEDVIPVQSLNGFPISEFSIVAARPLCDSGAGTTSEVFQIIVGSWEFVDNFPNLDGSDGFPSGTPGLVTPMRMSDTDGDTFIDEFNGGLILTYADTDTDGDFVNDAMTSSGERVFFATGLETLGVSLPFGVDANLDGIPDGGIQVTMTRGDGGDRNGPLFGGFYPATNTRILFGATALDDPSGCLAANDAGQGASDGTLWAEGYSDCNGGPGWSDGSASGGTDDLFDPLVDLKDMFGAIPGYTSVGIAMRLCGQSFIGDSDCCDINQNYICDPGDFTAWIDAFNGSLPTCDVNQDGQCSPADFTAWVNAYNNSIAGTPFLCVF